MFALVHSVHVTQIHSTALTASLPLTDETQVSPGGVWVNIYAEAVTPCAAAGSSTGKEISASEAAEPADNRRYDGVQQLCSLKVNHPYKSSRSQQARSVCLCAAMEGVRERLNTFDVSHGE